MPAHLAAVLVCALAVCLFVIAGRAAQARGRQRRFETTAGAFGIGLIAVKYTWYWMPASGAELFVPLQLCNLSEWFACLWLLTRRHWLRSILYFWALGTLMVFVTPEPPDKPGTLTYALFWASHAFILAVVVYSIAVAQFRPGAGDLALALGVTAGYVALVFAVNLAFGTNYGYIGPERPGTPTLIDFLGPWPLRVVWIVLIGAAAFVLAWLPWALLRRRSC